MEYYIAIRNDTPEAQRMDLTHEYGGKIVHLGKCSELWMVDVDDEQLKSLRHHYGIPIKPKYNVGDEFNYMGKRLVITKIDFHEVNGAWQVVYFYGKKQNEYAYEKQLE